MICEPGCGVKRLNRCLCFSNLVCNEWMVIVFDRLPMVWYWFSPPSSSCTPLLYLCLTDCQWCGADYHRLPHHVHLPLYLGHIRGLLQSFHCALCTRRWWQSHHLWWFPRVLLLAATQHTGGMNSKGRECNNVDMHTSAQSWNNRFSLTQENQYFYEEILQKQSKKTKQSKTHKRQIGILKFYPHWPIVQCNSRKQKLMITLSRNKNQYFCRYWIALGWKSRQL